MDYITITNLKVFAHHGVLPEETKNGQDFYVSAKLYLDTHEAGTKDDLEQSVHYGLVCELIHKIMTENTYLLIERVANEVLLGVVEAFPLIREMEVTIHKPHAPIPLPFENVSVTIKRSWHRAFIAFGSNLGDKEAYINEAIDKLSSHRECKLIQKSSLLVTKPYGGVEQDDFVNGMLELETLLEPEQLLKLLNQIESEALRERKIHWGPRTLDLDIIFYDDLIINTRNLKIPHVDMHNRKFVLNPMVELEPTFVHPRLNKTVQELLNNLQD